MPNKVPKHKAARLASFFSETLLELAKETLLFPFITIGSLVRFPIKTVEALSQTVIWSYQKLDGYLFDFLEKRDKLEAAQRFCFDLGVLMSGCALVIIFIRGLG